MSNLKYGFLPFIRWKSPEIHIIQAFLTKIAHIADA